MNPSGGSRERAAGEATNFAGGSTIIASRLRAMPIEAAPLPNAPACKVLRSIHKGARDLARDIANADA
jgi:hypothetical protein